jgi:hypothetical protein
MAALFRHLSRAILLAALPLPLPAAAAADALLKHIWQGVQTAQKKYTSGCGTITETRHSPLLVKPRVFRGKFCAAGTDRFFLEYSEPDRISIKFNRDYLNVSTGRGGKDTEVIEVGHNVRRTQAYFSKDNSIENLQKNFVIAAKETAGVYEMRLTPRSERFRSRINYVVVKLGKEDFLLRSLEVDGKSGVNSVFTIQIGDLNAHPKEDMFKVYKPR